ncbi:hypothetical protein [Streptomyces sp. NPDC058579]|uniref:hypothetical protein n=1 Tax=Streptomyces sp. NPDC058579 TaxID=3346548 RepID=UPI003666A498
MADERYQWLDQEAAENLLRGEPVDAVDDHTRTEADRLAGALAEVRPAPLAHAVDVELPGEADALAAFRAAAAERGLTLRSGPHASHAPPAPQAVAELDAVRITQARAARRWGRSLRYGLAAAVAAVAVGGVAVASGSGMLPFTTDGPAPAGSVSAADTPGPVSSHSPDSSESPGPRVDTVTPSVPGTGDQSPPGASPSAPLTPTPSGTTGSGDGTGAPDGSGGKGGAGGTGDGTPEPEKSTPAGKDGETTGAKLTKACQDFRAGRIDETAKRRLAQSARTGETLRRFCDRVLADPNRSDGDDGSGKGESGDGRGGWGDSRTKDRASAPSATPGRVLAQNRASDPAPTRLADLLGVPSMNTV